MSSSKPSVDRREFLKHSAAATATTAIAASSINLDSLAAQDASATSALGVTGVYQFPPVDSLVHPSGWQSLNPGFWQIKNGALRRRLTNVGDRARRTGFPFHSMSKGGVMQTQYDPSLPAGIIYRSDVRMSGSYQITLQMTYRGDRPSPIEGDDPNWKMYQDGYGQMGVALGAKSLFESFGKNRNATEVVWADDQTLTIKKAGKRQKPVQTDAGDPLQTGETVTLVVDVKRSGGQASVQVAMKRNGKPNITLQTNLDAEKTEGFVGIVGRGLIDFEVNRMEIQGDWAENATDENATTNHSPTDFDCYACYPLGDTLTQNDHGQWTVRFVGIFHSDGKQAQIRIADTPSPADGWENVAIAGSGEIISNDFRRNTAVIDATLCANPADKTMYYTVWKDGRDVTTDWRIGSSAVGPGTGLVGDVPTSGQYVGRLPQLKAPYRMCGLSCHAITSGLQVKTDNGYRIVGGSTDWQFRDQPSEGSYQHLDEFQFQVMVWEDDVWYMELVMYPPSTDDAYKIINQSICGPTSRWQMMRHWNIINPGDHDYGMDDVKGPEQLIIRRVDGLGQDKTYMQRNFKIVHHLTTGAQQVDPLANPKKWRAWKMPNQDFTLVVLDSRLWRSSQDTDLWDDSGWDNFKSLYDRTDPTRSLLGEEQFAWLQQLITTDASRLICLTGINGLHTIWTGGKGEFESGLDPQKFNQRDRVTADYAGWVKAGADRVLELIGSRDGIVTIYGDVHNGCIMRNNDHRIVECSFGPIGRSGGRGVIPGFGPQMKDVDGRDLEIISLYHKEYADAELHPHPDDAPFYWNFLELEFDPSTDQADIRAGVRNLIDSPQDTPRGGGKLHTTASETGRPFKAFVKNQTTLANADVRFTTIHGRPIRATRSSPDGNVPVVGLDGVDVGDEVLMVVTDGEQSESKIVLTQSA